ncbi:hypothetical protein EVAR_41341_1 [Eumeta japonica]|uniref:Uncharacterized protein n=1 Tax=Eumeta variegata TaxID=151549 RepID=A0A4C1X588_EUMVA|nr:hypothetical protein EVAR_41341_1 [Eumeta japonica]
MFTAPLSDGRSMSMRTAFEPRGTDFDPDQGRIERFVLDLNQNVAHPPRLGGRVQPLVDVMTTGVDFEPDYGFIQSPGKKGEKATFVLTKTIEETDTEPGARRRQSFLGQVKGESIFEPRETKSGLISEATIDGDHRGNAEK